MGLIGGMARTAVVAGTATAVSNRISRHQAGRWAAQDQAQQRQGYIPVGRYARPPGRYQWPMFQPPPPPQQHTPVPQVPSQYQRPPMPAPVADDMSTRLAQLQQLGQLRAQGTLSEEEFEAQKGKILDG